jgi:hypothetical protein
MGHGVVNYVAFARLFQLNVDRSEGLPHPCCGRNDNVSSCPCGQDYVHAVWGQPMTPLNSNSSGSLAV